jgi:hypothetical protein
LVLLCEDWRCTCRVAVSTLCWIHSVVFFSISLVACVQFTRIWLHPVEDTVHAWAFFSGSFFSWILIDCSVIFNKYISILSITGKCLSSHFSANQFFFENFGRPRLVSIQTYLSR